MTKLDPTHRYSKQAGKQTERAFAWTWGTVLVVLFIVAFTAWWWLLLAVVAVVIAFEVYTHRLPNFEILDITANQFLTVPRQAWLAFKREHPAQWPRTALIRTSEWRLRPALFSSKKSRVQRHSALRS